jgi:DNA (cytosine-5)-methyltransferase 1
MNYLSVCSGVEAASVAWKGLGWNPLGFSEIEKFPSEVLQHHYPNVPNLGDMNNYKEWNFGKRSVDLVVGGTPCQSFSVAGLRKGMEDPRGNLALTFCAILDKFRPKWFVWENVPGVLSSNKGRDFGSFLGAVAELGYGASYRVLDAQNFGVPQRRRRVFVVGHLGDWKPTAEVLFESESLRWHPKKSKKAREDSTGYIEGGFGAYNQSDVGGTTKASGGVLGGGSETFIYVADKAPTLTSSAAGFSRPGNDATADSQYIGTAYNITFCDANGTRKDRPNGGLYINKTNVSNTLTNTGVGTNVAQQMAVRRLTPIECERLQGFPDNYTNIKENCPDGPRYKAMGNSMAVPVMKWIGTRINNYKEENYAV